MTQPLPEADPGNDLQPLSTILARLSDVLSEMTFLSDQLQSITGDLLDDPDRVSDSVYQLQGLDRLHQTIAGLAGYTRALAADAPAKVCLRTRRAAGSVHLPDLRARLNGDATFDATSRCDDAGSVAIF